MKKNAVLIGIFICLTGVIYCQTPSVEWLLDDNTIVDFDIDSANNIIVLSQKDVGYDIIKYNNHGVKLWSRTDTFNINELKSIITDRLGNIHVIGTERVFDKHYYLMVGQGVVRRYAYYNVSFCIAKYDNSGNVLKYIKYKTSYNVGSINLKSSAFDSDNNLILCAKTSMGSKFNIDTCSIGWQDHNTYPSGGVFFNVKINTNGKLIWCRTYSPYEYDKINKTIIDKDDNIITVGRGRNDGVIFKINKHNKIIWEKYTGSNEEDEITDISVNKENDLTFSLFMGETIGNYDDTTILQEGNSSSNESQFILKIDENGKLLWHKPVILPRMSYSKLDIVNSNLNNILMFDFRERFQFDRLNAASDRTTVGLIKIDTNGDPVWSKMFGDGSHMSILDKALTDCCENVFILSTHFTPIKIDNFSIPSDKGKFLCKVSSGKPTSKNSRQSLVKKQLLLYPNPANSEINIKTNCNGKDVSLLIYNSTGATIYQQKTNENHVNINIDSFPNGIYIIKIVNDMHIMTGRFIKN